MAKKAPKILSGSELAVATAEKVFGWKNIRRHEGELIGKTQDKLALAGLHGDYTILDLIVGRLRNDLP
jgi:hypothetical protein